MTNIHDVVGVIILSKVLTKEVRWWRPISAKTTPQGCKGKANDLTKKPTPKIFTVFLNFYNSR